ncbi:MULTISPECIES: hypothetical protein [unclassified Streptomyces]|uniref:hypothetical protein n=1 Tax=unclassified Streptomyces TaxID=2593676 RepID=UPI003D72F147
MSYEGVRDSVLVSLVAALIVSSLPALGLYFSLRAMRFVIRLLSDERLLGRVGERTDGECVGLIPARRGVRLMVLFLDDSGDEHTFQSKVLTEALIPQVGESVGVVYLPDRPAVARITPRKAAADNVSWGCLALPFLAAVAFGAAALIARLLWEALAT